MQWLAQSGKHTLSLLVAVCTGMAGSAVADTPPAIVVGKTPAYDVMATAQNGQSAAIAQLPRIARDVMQRSGIPGAAIAVVSQESVLFSQGFGRRSLNPKLPVDGDTVFLVASLSKSITASVIATQVSKNVVSWDDPVVNHLPGFRLRDDYVTRHATIGDFMAHRTGLPFTAGDDLEDIGYSRETILERLRLLPLGPFRVSYNYANFGTTTAGQAVAAAAGVPWEVLADSALFQPLGMQHTSARYADFAKAPNRAVQHILEDGRFQALFERNADAQSPAGGVSSSANDMARWLMFLLAQGNYAGKAVASAESLRPALSPQAFSGPPSSPLARPGFYGFGFNVGVNANGRTTLSHSGAFVLGTGTHFQIIPSLDIGIVVLTNGSPVGAAEAIAAEFLDLVQYGRTTRDWYAAYNAVFSGYLQPAGDLAGKTHPPHPAPARTLSDYTGTYENPYFGRATLLQKDGRLWIELGPLPTVYALTHWNGNTFALTPRSENEPKGSRSSVQFDEKDGAVTGMTITYLNHARQGVWTRAEPTN